MEKLPLFFNIHRVYHQHQRRRVDLREPVAERKWLKLRNRWAPGEKEFNMHMSGQMFDGRCNISAFRPHTTRSK